MAKPPTDKFSAGEQGLGYIYQARLALLRLLQLPENTAVFLEKDDDLDFVDDDGGKFLASLKHKSIGDRLTDLSPDFWKSVNIWLERYKRDGRAASNLQFFLFTTSTVPPSREKTTPISAICTMPPRLPRARGKWPFAMAPATLPPWAFLSWIMPRPTTALRRLSSRWLQTALARPRQAKATMPTCGTLALWWLPRATSPRADSSA